jgi:hypothetical protein
MYPFIYIQIHMLEVRVKQLEKQARDDFRYNQTLLARFVALPRKEAADKEVIENPVARAIFIMS